MMKQSMKWRWAMVTLVVSLLLSVACGMAAQAEDVVHYAQTGQLEVRGQAIRTVMPDTVDIMIGATAQHDTEQGALNEVNPVIANVIASLKALDIPENQIKTSTLNISPRYSTFGSSSRIIGYTASISLTVTLKDFEMINTVIDTSVAHGANDIGGMRFSFSDEGLVYRQALTDAITVAREKAETMVAAAGVKLGTLLVLRESGYNTYSYANAYAPSMMEAETFGGAATQVMAGEIQISAAVDLVYETR